MSCSELDLTDTVRSDGTVSQAESGHLFVSRGWALSTHTCLWRFSGPPTDVLCKLPFAEFVEINRIRCKRSLLEIYRRAEVL